MIKKYLIGLVLFIFLASCVIRESVFVTNVDITGVVVQSDTCVDCRYGNNIYSIRSKNGHAIRYITDTIYEVGDSISISTRIKRN